MAQKKAPTKKKNPAPAPASSKYLPYLLACAAFLLYANTLNHGYVLDDDFVTRKNRLVQQGMGGIGEIFSHGFFYGFNGRNDQAYRPLTVASFAVEYAFFKNNPQVSHFVNILLFALLVLVMYKLLSGLFGSRNTLIPALITLLFAVHPIHTEVVANIKSRDELLTFLLAISSLYFLWKYLQQNKTSLLAASLGLYLLSLLSKESSFTLVATVPLFIYIFTAISWKKNLAITGGFAAMAGLYMLIRTSVLDAVTFDEKLIVINNSLVAAQTPGELWGTKFLLLFQYLKLSILPWPLSSDYSFNQVPITGLGNPVVILSVLLHLALFGYAVWGLKKKNPVSYGIFFYLITLSVSSNFFVLIGSTFAERFLFTPSFGICLALVLAAAGLFTSIRPEHKKWFAYALAPILIVFAALSFLRNQDWKDNLTLFRSDVKTSSNSARMHFLLGTAYMNNGDMGKDPRKKYEDYSSAVKELQEAVRIYPQFDAAQYNLGVCLNAIGEKDQAITAYKNTLSASPQYRNANNNIGVIFFEKNQLDSAMHYFKQELAIDSTTASSLGNVGAVYHNQGNLQEAIRYYEKAIRLDPKNVNNYNNIIRAYNGLGQPDKALYYQQEMQKAGAR